MGQNGCGKSLILDSITFALYGTAFRKINKPQLVNSITKKDCLVELEFKIEKKKYLVRRGVNPGLFEIYCNGHILNQNAAFKDYQKDFLKNIFPMPENAFRQMVMLGTASFKPFFDLPLGQRRDIIENMLDIKIFSTMNNLLKNKISSNKQDVRETESLKRELEGKLELVKKHRDNIKTRNVELIETYNKNIEENSNKIRELEEENILNSSKIEENNQKITNADKVYDSKNKGHQYRSECASLLKSLRKEIEFLKENDSCPTCQQSITKEFKKNSISKKADRSKKIIEKQEEVNAYLEKIEKKIEKIIEVNQEISKLNNKISYNNQNITILNNEIKKIEKNIQQVEQDNLKETNEDIKDIAKSIRLNGKRKETLLKEQHVNDLASILLKDSGIKAKIIAQYVPIINKIMNKYLSELDLFVDFELDESFSESFRSRGRDNFSYHSFSEGQKARINIALLLTWREVTKLRNSISTNLLVLDEIFGSSLDGDGSELLVEIIKNMQNSNVFIIEHKVEMFDKFHSSIRIGMERGFTKMLSNGEE